MSFSHVAMQCLSVAFPGHTHLTVVKYLSFHIFLLLNFSIFIFLKLKYNWPKSIIFFVFLTEFVLVIFDYVHVCTRHVFQYKKSKCPYPHFTF